ncbi:nickel ABC transporter ATP-binding protein NikE [Paractinoplanes brasiliensis]|uniref:Peptide/nickel transport system ATP-binding protein n=1 Tax=Paractinoplanes brasiliensis TaxID=52695 RepID=A0A4R6J7N7_9ACTN|nr:ABC transporter ATP-binding protein [Actinoplanes brasiliensis]TDO31544.1 peptide/nickel transport system ATP-binding protein [Actinoplanes brasiliensis]GID30943.1 ABC transporter ATP-binding protein [Actinoplanes brasiliensis]
MNALVRVRGLSVAYTVAGRRIDALHDVGLAVRPGETVAVVGESGCGKTTLARALVGLLPAAAQVVADTIEVAGRELKDADDRAFRTVRGSVVGFVPQDPATALNPTMRVGAQVAEAVRRRPDVARRAVRAEVVALLEAAGLDEAERRARQYPHELSGGMRQRVLTAMALAGNPRLLIADEPTSALDVIARTRVLDHLRRLAAHRNLSLLLITHDLAVAAEYAQRIVAMHAGRVIEHRPVRRFEAAPGQNGARRPPLAEAPPILRLEDVSKVFRLPRASRAGETVRAVDQLTLTVARGQTLGLVGRSGAGKTTTLRIAGALERPDTGRVILDGVDITGWSPRRLRPLRRRFQLVHQNPYASLDPAFTVEQTVTEPLLSFRIGDRTTRQAAARELLDRVGLPRAYLNRRPDELSGGQCQRVAIARALALHPSLLLLDEPVSALDAAVQDQILTLLATLQRDLGLSYLLVSHDLAVVARLADHVAVLDHGRLVEHGTTNEVFAAPADDITRHLLAAIPAVPPRGPTGRDRA